MDDVLSDIEFDTDSTASDANANDTQETAPRILFNNDVAQIIGDLISLGGAINDYQNDFEELPLTATSFIDFAAIADLVTAYVDDPDIAIHPHPDETYRYMTVSKDEQKNGAYVLLADCLNKDTCTFVSRDLADAKAQLESLTA